MCAQRWASLLVLLAVTLGATGCEAVDSARDRFARTDTVSTTIGSGLALGLQAPPLLQPGEQGILRVSLTNRTDTVVSQVRLELVAPGWLELMPPRVGDIPVTMAANADGTTLFSYRMDDTPLEPGRVQTVEQRIQVPASGLVTDSTVVSGRVIRARLLGADGTPLAEVESQIALDSAATSGAGASASGAPVRDRLGPLQLGMTAAAAKQAAPTSRDTTWSQEGIQQRGISVPVGNGRALAVVSENLVTRIEVADSAVRNAERLGVGSRVDELRAAYGPPCVEVAEGRVVVWFAKAPGISFALDTPVPQNVAQLRANPDRLPGTSKVTRWWLRRGVDTCASAGQSGG